MTYESQPVVNLLRGPLLRTPQGWVVLAGLCSYLLLALLFSLEAIKPPLGKDISSAVVICFFWPLITFLFFCKEGAPNFEPSWRQAALVGICALAPIGYVLVYG